jgi:hypothetical protein
MNDVTTLVALLVVLLAVSKIPGPGSWYRAPPDPPELPPPKKRKALPPRSRR